MSRELDEVEVIFLAIYESVWAVSDSVGFNIEVVSERVPGERIDVNSLASRLLHASLQDISEILKHLELLEFLIMKK